ncbi:MAG: transposase, partial [Phycisphaerae bacterium]|nr:transposase [Saprospiraceae bacterium]
MQKTKIHDLRTILNAILWMVRTGTQWRNLDSRYPKWQSIYYHFYRWSRNGTLRSNADELLRSVRKRRHSRPVENINGALNRLVRLKAGREALPSLICVDR